MAAVGSCLGANGILSLDGCTITLGNRVIFADDHFQLDVTGESHLFEYLKSCDLGEVHGLSRKVR